MADYPNFAGEAQFKDTASVPTPPANNLAVYSDGGVLKTKNSSGTVTTLGASNMVGATSSAAGTAGLVPQPAAGDQHKILRGDATFAGAPYTQKQNTNLTNRAIIRFDAVSSNYHGITGGYAFASNRMWFLPVYVPSSISSYNIVLSVQANANLSRKIKIGIYDLSSSTGLPSSRIAVSAEFDAACAADTEFSTAFTTTLNQGIYFLSVTAKDGLNMYGYNNTGYGNLLGISITGISNTLRYNVTYGTDEFPATLTASSFIIENSQVPRMYITGL